MGTAIEPGMTTGELDEFGRGLLEQGPRLLQSFATVSRRQNPCLPGHKRWTELERSRSPELDELLRYSRKIRCDSLYLR
jgi:hypothetical protein